MPSSVLLAASFPPDLGGIETLLYETSRRLSPAPLVLAPPPAAACAVEVKQVPTRAAGRLLYRPLWRLHPSLHYLLTFWRPTTRVLSARRPAVLQIGHIFLGTLALLFARRIPYVVYAYGQEVLPRPVGTPFLDARLRGRALRAATAVLVPGEFTADLVSRWGVQAERIVRVPYGAQPRPAAAPPSGSTLLSVCRLVPRKGVDNVIRALARLPRSIDYRIVGSGPDEPRLRQLACDCGVADRVQFLGRLSQADLEAEFRRCAVCIQPSRRTADGQLEGYGLVYFEAAALGRAVIAGRSGGEADAVIDGETGLLVDGESVDQIADAIGSLMGDPARMQALGEAGRHRVETSHNWDCAAAVVDQVLGQAALR